MNGQNILYLDLFSEAKPFEGSFCFLQESSLALD